MLEPSNNKTVKASLPRKTLDEDHLFLPWGYVYPWRAPKVDRWVAPRLSERKA